MQCDSKVLFDNTQHSRRKSSSTMTSSCKLALMTAALLLAATPKAMAGAVFETVEAIPQSDEDYQFVYNTKTFGDFGTDSVISTEKGAGKYFASSHIPMEVRTLTKCSVLSPHYHPNGAKQVYVLEGCVMIYWFRGESDGTTVRKMNLCEGQAGYIEQGAVHTMQNLGSKTTKFLQVFDHPQHGIAYLSQVNVNMPTDIINGAYSNDIITSGVRSKGQLYRINNCAEGITGWVKG